MGGGGVNRIKDPDYQAWLSSHKPFHWFIAFYGILKEGGFDVIIGNPPYVEYSKVKNEYEVHGYQTENCGNLFAFTTERSLKLLNTNGGFGFIVPLSLVCTKRMEILQSLLTQFSKSVWLSNFAERPSKLFVGAEVQLTILLSRSDKKRGSGISTTDYTKWSVEERTDLFNGIGYLYDVSNINSFIIPKLGLNTEFGILEKINTHTSSLGNYLLRRSEYIIFYRMSGGRYWKVFTDFSPSFKVNGRPRQSTAEKHLYVETQELSKSIIAVLSSNLFWWWYTITTDCRNLPTYTILDFPVLKSMLNDFKLVDIGQKYLDDLCYNSIIEVRQQSNGQIENQAFKVQKSKHIIDEIDRVLAKHYGFTDEELDFIINYDIKYRMSLGN